MSEPVDPPLDLPPGSEDEALLQVLHGIRAVPTVAALLEAVQELGSLRMDWAQQAETIHTMQDRAVAQQARIDRLQGAIARLSRSLAEAHALALPGQAPADADADADAD